MTKGKPPKTKKLKAGATWSDFMAAFNSLADGDILQLPNTPVVQEATLFITKPVQIKGSSPESKLLALTNLSSSGSAQQIMIGYGGGVKPYTTVDGVVLSGFMIEHTRNYDARMIAISIFGHSKNVDIHDIHFKNITSDCIITRNESTVAIEGQYGVIEDIYIYNNRADEWWESFFNHHEGSLSRCYVYDNICTVMAGGHPDSRVSRPYAALINIEETKYHGLIETVYIQNNTFVSNLYNFTLGQAVELGHGTDYNDSIGWALRKNEEPDYRAHKVVVSGNHFQGWDRGLWHIQTQTHLGSSRFPGPSKIEYARNRFEDFRSISVDDWGAAGDEVIFGDNDIIGPAPVFPGGSGVVNIIQQPPNRVTTP